MSLTPLFTDSTIFSVLQARHNHLSLRSFAGLPLVIPNASASSCWNDVLVCMLFTTLQESSRHVCFLGLKPWCSHLQETLFCTTCWCGCCASSNSCSRWLLDGQENSPRLDLFLRKQCCTVKTQRMPINSSSRIALPSRRFVDIVVLFSLFPTVLHHFVKSLTRTSSTFVCVRWLAKNYDPCRSTKNSFSRPCSRKRFVILVLGTSLVAWTLCAHVFICLKKRISTFRTREVTRGTRLSAVVFGQFRVLPISFRLRPIVGC